MVADLIGRDQILSSRSLASFFTAFLLTGFKHIHRRDKPYCRGVLDICQVMPANSTATDDCIVELVGHCLLLVERLHKRKHVRDLGTHGIHAGAVGWGPVRGD